ncbi:MAG: peptidoglycan DD-metalloendopeptidase family protein [Xanthomonadales bacterium]|nr:peptidoglycan DD-metalloendopeptidase family protein [Xanthomonadales bacterium]
MNGRWRIRHGWAASLVLVLLLAPSAWSQDSLTREQAQARLTELKTEIAALQARLERARKDLGAEQRSLRELDLAVQAAARRLRETEAQQAQRSAELRQLELQRSQYLDGLRARKTALAEQMVAAYQIGRESRLKLLLNQDNPARLGRMLAYYAYFNQAQVAHISELLEALERLARMQAEIDAALQALEETRRAQQAAATDLDAQRNERQAALEALSGIIDREQGRLTELTRNQQDLEALIERLGDALADIPADLGEYQSPEQLRGALPLPVKGPVRHAFGQARLGGLSWQGWLIEAERGAEVRSIAYGRVAYADWLRGYGLLMIIDHGDGFMSLYGNNESLLFDVGDWVQPKAVISTVGSNPTGGQGLYFELRRQGKAIDPATWIAR